MHRAEPIALYLMVAMSLAIMVRSCFEWRVSQRNYSWWIERGGVEREHQGHRLLAAFHIAWLCGLVTEVAAFGRTISPFWPALTSIVACAWGVRLWCMLSGGSYWTLRAVLRPTSGTEPNDPYRWTAHPFALAAIIEVVAVPLLFNAYLSAITTAAAYSIAIMMYVRALADHPQGPATRSTSHPHTSKIDTPT